MDRLARSDSAGSVALSGASARPLRTLAAATGCSVLAVARAAWMPGRRDDDRLRVGDLSDHDHLTDEADAVVLLHDPAHRVPGERGRHVLEVEVAVNRLGPTGTVEVAHRREWGLLADLAAG